MRERILNGNLSEEKCSYKDAYEFLMLLKRKDDESDNSITEEISAIEWERVMKKAKRTSVSSVFLYRTYGVYKCALEVEEMMKILIVFYNKIIKQEIYLKW